MPDPLDDHEVDERFADIVEQWRVQAAQDTDAAASTTTDAGDQEAPTAPDSPPDDTAVAPTPDPPSTPDPPPDLVISVDQAWRRPADRPTWDEVLDAEEAQGFVPPPVELPPGEDLHYWGALVGLVAGPLIVLWVAFGGASSSGWWLIAGIGLTVAGFALLVLRMPTHREPDDHDDGARV